MGKVQQICNNAYNDAIQVPYSHAWSSLLMRKGLLTVSWTSRFISEIEAICRQWLADGAKILMVELCMGDLIFILVW